MSFLLVVYIRALIFITLPVLLEENIEIGLVCQSISVSGILDSSETACRNFVFFHMNIKYDVGMVLVFSQFQYPRWLSGSSHFIA